MSDEEYTLKSSIENAVWNLREQEENNCLILFTDEKVNYQPWFYDLGEPNPETRLNGRLMAMSPQMLKLLFEARAALRTVDPELVEDITSVIDYIDPECLPIKRL